MKVCVGSSEWVNDDDDGLFDWVLAKHLYEQPFGHTRDEAEWDWLMAEISIPIYDEALYLADAIEFYTGRAS